MSILIDSSTRVVVQGMTGEQASFHTKASIEYGTNVVAGVTPGKGGTTHLDRPIFETLAQAVEATDANASMIFVPPWFTADAVLEAIDLDADGDLDLLTCEEVANLGVFWYENPQR